MNYFKPYVRNATGILLLAALIYCGIWFFQSRKIISDSVLYNLTVQWIDANIRSENVFPGANGWLFFKDDFRAITRKWNCKSENLEKLVTLNDSLKSMGIHLLVVPVPDKITIVQNYTYFKTKTASNQRKDFINSAVKRGVDILDLTGPFLAFDKPDVSYRRRDTHWNNRGIKRAAAVIAERISEYVEDTELLTSTLRDTSIVVWGDLAKMAGDSTTLEETISMVERNPHSFGIADDKIVILGDSFAAAYEKFNASIGDHLSFVLGKPVKTIATLRGNREGPRLILKHVHNMEEKPRVVVWIFVSRYLTHPFVFD